MEGASESHDAITAASVAPNVGVTVTGRRLPARLGQPQPRKQAMRMIRTLCLGVLTSFVALAAANAQQQRSPNILVIMGDDVGWFNIGAYHRGIMSGNAEPRQAGV